MDSMASYGSTSGLWSLCLCLLLRWCVAAELQVIGAGFGRTGTMTLKHMLEHLGHRTYHMQEIIDTENHHAERWLHIGQAHAAGQPVVPMLRELFLESNYSAAVDFPVAAYWEELMEAFPSAKVILTIKDPESWYKSGIATIFAFSSSWQIRAIKLLSPFFRTHSQMGQVAIWDKLLGPGGGDPAAPEMKQAMLSAFSENTRRARERVPKTKLLEMKVGDGGWKPLCDFLRVDEAKCPSGAVPHKNDRGAFFTTFLLPISIALILIFSSPLWLSCLVLCCCCRSSRGGKKKDA
eukprot:gnl/TRDRNA2_/TRDRNA2_33455_c0_seq1.p1 gnl/TRDRNA2_/TRDRNA2_33455_c0~~gnl/TRDRNA2_/TRDRNA2_33455_c0_seq1.p1  ORF type:complete len:293 (-),score=45.66 gnl/TRDRNA2_/TRDRNA2_33455_c0_seq1:149-1027(-)